MSRLDVRNVLLLLMSLCLVYDAMRHRQHHCDSANSNAKTAAAESSLSAFRSNRSCDVHTHNAFEMGNRLIAYVKVLLAAAENEVHGCAARSTFEQLTPLFELTSEWVSMEEDKDDKESRHAFIYAKPGDLKKPLKRRSDSFQVKINFNPFGLKLVEERREFLRQNIRMRPWIQEAVDAYLGNFHAKTLVGVHIRKTRKILGEGGTDLCFTHIGSHSDFLSNCFPEFYQGAELLKHLENVMRFLYLQPAKVVFLVASDDPEWCRRNLLAGARETGLDLRLTHDHFRGVEMPASVRSKHFDWAVLASVDNLVYLLGTYATTAGLLGRCKNIFLPKYLPGEYEDNPVMLEESEELNSYGMVGLGSRFHFLEDL